ncbi:hypothetical protein BIU95_00875 [Curtobacterium sp. MCBA15_007]|uniref:RHS repeat-associated core domain-containing protein n=1 Tax=Curtobacterium sp. MCBA15_007 TaxID=1898735 RepID=UPI0008DD72FB|nr:RHS repeat-associated core domain-containing protein [Curtobacterium sp. MCBA15_007]OII09664.1 hypothetical protein BIU95_00875 [Curtobacterium sp. MCBA15_007]
MWVIDGTGNPVAAIADSGKTAYTVSYDPYGVETVTVGGDSAQWKQNPYGFKSGLRSSSTDNGLTKFGYRWQSSVTGGWIERDTLDAPLSPSNANRYAFAGADPINKSDSSGRSVGGAAVNAGVATIAAVGTAAVCASTAGIGCLVGGVVLGGVFGGFGGIAQEAVEGGDNYGQAALEGTVSGAIGGFGGGIAGKLIKYLPRG